MINRKPFYLSENDRVTIVSALRAHRKSLLESFEKTQVGEGIVKDIVLGEADHQEMLARFLEVTEQEKKDAELKKGGL